MYSVLVVVLELLVPNCLWWWYMVRSGFDYSELLELQHCFCWLFENNSLKFYCSVTSQFVLQFKSEFYFTEGK